MIHRHLTEDTQQIIHSIRIMEIDLLAFIDEILDVDTAINGRWYAVAKTHFEQGFMALARSVARPED